MVKEYSSVCIYVCILLYAEFCLSVFLLMDTRFLCFLAIVSNAVMYIAVQVSF